MKLISISEASRLTGKDRKTVKKAAEGLESFPGPKNSMRYRSTQLLQRLYVGGNGEVSYSEALRLLCVARERLATTQNRDAEIKLAERQRELISVDDSVRYWETFAVHVKSILDSWPEPDRTLAYFKLQECAILAGESMGVDCSKERAELAQARSKFEAEVKAGRVPRHWSDTWRPDNDGRVWSTEKNRYLTKREIISKYGPGVQISPIDEILDEAEPS